MHALAVVRHTQSCVSVGSESACVGFAMLTATHDDEYAHVDADVDDDDDNVDEDDRHRDVLF